ncbi:MAG: TldD/PmbA family protein [Polyangiaceae bacterium]
MASTTGSPGTKATGVPTSGSADDVLAVARRAVELARKAGAQEVAALATKSREVEVTVRDGRIEKLSEATSRDVSFDLYVDGRFSTARTSDLRSEALEAFVREAVALARTLTVDPHRHLPDPKYYEGRSDVDLEIRDPAHPARTTEERKRTAAALEAAARDVPGRDHIVSVLAYVGDGSNESARVASNGFEGVRRSTHHVIGADVSVKDQDGRRPEDGAFAMTRFAGDLPDVATLGKDASSRALGRLGSKKGPSERMAMVIDARAAERFLSMLMGPLSSVSIQQKRSFLEGKLGTAIASPKLTLVDDPFVRRGLASRHYDDEGMTARKFPIVEAGVLKNFLVSNYYGRKLGMAPTTQRVSNVVWTLGSKDRAGLLADVKEAILVTSFLGGNSNGTTGDYSLGVQGYRVRKGRIEEPVGEMNISGNHTDTWKALAAVGNDPYPWSSMRSPSLLFEGIQFAGT